MKICKFCRRAVKAQELKKRTVNLPTGLPVTSLDPMCKICYNNLNKQYENNSLSWNTNNAEVKGTSESTPNTEGQ